MTQKPGIAQSHYELLNLPHGASLEQIKKSYKQLALAYHPDTNKSDPQAEQKFIIIANAYEVLSDNAKRAKYDEYLRTSPSFHQNRDSENISARTKIDSDYIANSLNILLWDMEDFLKEDSKKTRVAILAILTFIDKWILGPAGFPDYFFEARRLTPPDPRDYIFILVNGNMDSGHLPYTDVRDYFFDIRRRLNRFLSRVDSRLLLQHAQENNTRIIDSIVEAQNFAQYCLGLLNHGSPRENLDIKNYKFSSPIYFWNY